MTDDLNDILDDLFHGCAFAAFMEQAVLTGDYPCPERTRRRAFQLYEQALRSQTKHPE